MLKRKKLLHLSDAQLCELLQHMHHEELLSILAMADKLEVSRDTLYAWCKHFDIPVRSGSEANRVRMQKLSTEERKQLTSKANKSARGRKHSIEEKLKRAAIVSSRTLMSEHEKTFAKILIDADLYDFIFSYPVHIYNIDFAFPLRKVAIEVDGGNWHTSPRKQEQDAKKEAFLTSEGWELFRWSNLDSPSKETALLALLEKSLH